jgi:hypothetical protein
MKVDIKNGIETAMFAVGILIFGLSAFVRYEQDKLLFALGCILIAAFCTYELVKRLRSFVANQNLNSSQRD